LTKFTFSDKVQKYNFDSGNWKQLSPYGFPVVLSTVVWVPTEGLLYSFGGYYDYFSEKKTDIYKMVPKEGNAWKYFGKMSYSSSKPLVVPYVNKVITK
jgi:hypothetical protein